MRIPVYNERLGTFVNRKVIYFAYKSEVDSTSSQTTYTHFTGDVDLGHEHWHSHVHELSTF
jgi:hypothetical protein